MSIEIGDKAPDFTLPTDGNGKVSCRKLRGQQGRALFLSQGRHLGLHRRGLRLPRQSAEIRQGRSGGDRHLARQRRRARQVQEKVRPALHARRRRGGQGVRALWRLGREEHVRPQIHGHRARHLPHRREGHRARRLAQGEGAGPCRGGARRRARRSDSAAGSSPPPPAPCWARRRRRRRSRSRNRSAGAWRAESWSRSATRRRPTGRPGPSGRRCWRRATCPSGARAARPPRASRCCTRWRISSSTPSILPGTSSRAFPAWRCRAPSTTTGSASPPRRRSTIALLAQRLAELGAAYGDLPAHDGLWQAAAATAHDLLARLAVVPLVLEARGLDVTPVMIARLERAGDGASAAVLRVIYADEIGHVAIGLRWFDGCASSAGCRRRRPTRVSCGGISKAR